MNSSSSPTGDSTADLASEALPLGARMSRGRVAMAWWSICSAMFYLFLGATLALNYGTRNALIGMVLSVIVFGLLNATLAQYSARTGLSCSALSRVMFGAPGGALATLILCAAAIFYAVFESSVLAVAMSKVIPGLKYGTAAVLIVAYSVPLVFGSVQLWLNRLNGVLLPFYLLGLALIVTFQIVRNGYTAGWLHLAPSVGASAYGWWNCVVAYLGVLILSMGTMDFARFGRPQDAVFNARVNFGIPFYLMTFLINGVVGIFLVSTIDAPRLTETSVVESSLTVLGSGVGLVWIWITQTRINTANYYLSIVNLQAFIHETFGFRLPKIACAIGVGLVVLFLLRATDVFSYLLTALKVQGVFITAWVAVALSHVLGHTGSDITVKATPEICATPGSSGWLGGLLAWMVGALFGGIVLEFGGGYAVLSVPSTLIVSAVTYRLLGDNKRR